MRVPDLDPRFGNNFIDTNALDSTGGPGAAAMDEILRLCEESADEEHPLALMLPYSVQEEMEHPHTPAEVKRKAENFVFSVKVELIGPELARHNKVRDLIRGKARPGQHDRDAFHLVESAKYGRHFITNDRRLLKKSEEIWEILQLKVLKPSEFLAAYIAHGEREHI
jgi:predicted nucleic acid-binding protein